MTGLSDSSECRHFTRQRCGGCAFLHVPYAKQLDAKRTLVADILRSAFHSLPPARKRNLKHVIKKTVPSPREMGHRASAKFCLHEDHGGHQVVGLYQQGHRIVIDTIDCPANVPLANEIASRLFIDRSILPAKFYDHQNGEFQRNRFKFATIRTSPAGAGTLSDAAVILTHTGVNRAAIAGWLKHAGLADLCVYESLLAKEDGESIFGRSVTPVSGPETFPYRLGDDLFDIAPTSFFQANHALAPALIDAATAFKEPGDILLDLYGGFGAYSFRARGNFQEVLVVDGNHAAIAALNRHARDIDAPYVRGAADSCEHFLETALRPATADRVSHLIVNPARTGLSDEVRRLIAPATFPTLRAVHYISCNPATFARDAIDLILAGFNLESVEPFDMFPHADHVEVVGIFRM